MTKLDNSGPRALGDARCRGCRDVLASHDAAEGLDSGGAERSPNAGPSADSPTVGLPHCTRRKKARKLRCSNICPQAARSLPIRKYVSRHGSWHLRPACRKSQVRDKSRWSATGHEGIAAGMPSTPIAGTTWSIALTHTQQGIQASYSLAQPTIRALIGSNRSLR